MTGSTLTVTVAPPPVDPSHSHVVPRSQSTPNLLSPLSPTSNATSYNSRYHDLSFKSLPSLPAFDVSSFDLDDEFERIRSSNKKAVNISTNERDTIDWTETNEVPPAPRTGRMGSRRRSILGRSQSWMPYSKSSPSIGQLVQEKDVVEDETTNEEPDGSDNLHIKPPLERSKTVSDSFASFARRSWISKSRSPSPKGATESVEDAPEEEESLGELRPNRSSGKLQKNSRRRSKSTIENNGNKSTESPGGTSKARHRASLFVHKIKQRPQSMLVKNVVHNDSDSTASSVASLAPTYAEPQRSHSPSETSGTTAPDDLSTPTDKFVPKDPLWPSFKLLEAEYSRFQSRTTSMRMNMVRTTLLPILRNSAHNPSYKHLSSDDLEKRVFILNKWWQALLEMVEGKAKQYLVPGVDKPVLFEATTLLMMRPEWRQTTTSFQAFIGRSPRERIRTPSRTGSSDEDARSSNSAYVNEYADCNVRTMFLTNLVSQMAIVVEKLSMKHAPLSLVNFAGKACAYAFFFAPGIADVLVRLWGLSADLIRRVADEFRLPRRSRGESDDIVALFPPNMGALGWTSVKTMSDSLRQAATLPLATAKIHWHGPWVARWRGRDTDHFFLFCKYYCVLAEEFMPPGLPLVEKARAPAFLLVHAQLLQTLDSTIHRQAAVEAMFGPPLADALHGADASAMAMPVAPNNNVMKGMSENRLIVLLKDFLCEASMTSLEARHTFAESFMAIMKAATKRTSQFDHSACFTLCDFLEESLVTYENFVDVDRPLDYVDWPFWFEVCRKILDCNNTMSEIRMLAMIFSIWDVIASDPARKEAICLDWLLTEENFHKFFNNWCPMIRAYYMRLLCWRICRDTGSVNDTDTKIFLVVSDRLRMSWGHYLWLKQSAERTGRLLPSTAPCFPTPGKRFMIIRTEAGTPQQGLFVGFDSFGGSFPRQGFNNPSVIPTESPDSANADVAYKKKWSILGKVMSFSANNTDPHNVDALRRETASARTSPPPPPKSSANKVATPGSDADSLGSSPVYEAAQFIFRFTLAWNPLGTMSPPERYLTRPRLPAPAQSRVSSHVRNGSPTPPAGRPAPTRAYSGGASNGLIEAAKNADPSEIPNAAPRISIPNIRRMSDPDWPLFSDPQPMQEEEPIFQQPRIPWSYTVDNMTHPVKPSPAFLSGAKYTGRALAEWSVVVSECNNFVERRRDEGVLGLSEVEVPILGVEGFRKIG